MQPTPQVLPKPEELDFREFGDTDATRKNIYDNVLSAANAIEPISNARHTLRLTNIEYADPDKVSKKQQKEAILNGISVGRRLRGTWELLDNETQQIVDSKRAVLATIPHLTDRGTFINNGTEYTLKNQQRLLPGVYTRIRDNGEIESHANVMPGKGVSHRYFLDPEKGVFKIKVGQGTVGLTPLLKLMGATPEQLKEAWGKDLFATNYNNDAASEYAKLKQKFLNNTELQGSEVEQRQALIDKFARMELDPQVTTRTLGRPHKNITLDTLLDITKKLVQVSRNEADPDDRDALTYQQFLGPEDLIAERLQRDKDGIRRQLLWKSSWKGNLQSMPSSALGKQVLSALLTSGLGQAIEEINPAELYDKTTSVSRLGEGGIPSTDAIPKEARSVQPSMFGYVDPLRTPECYDRETEVMTRRGWVKWPDITEEDEFACLIEGRLAYHTASKLFRQHYKGLMYGADTGRVAYLVTPNHRLWVRPLDAGSQYRIATAEEYHDRPRLVCSGGFAPYKGENVAFFSIPKPEILSNNTKVIDRVPIDPWTELMGWWLGEGNSWNRSDRFSYGIKITQCRTANPANCARIERTLQELPFAWSYSEKAYTIATKQIGQYFTQFGKSPDRYIPEYLFKTPEAARQRLYDALLLGEGRKNRQGERTQFCTTSKQLARDFERLAFSLGHASRCVFESDTREQSNTGGTWVVHIHKTNEHQIRAARSRRKQCYIFNFDDEVFCATVPGGLLYVRRGDTIGHWSGNSGKVGVDTYLARGVRKGKNGKLYAQFRELKTGQLVYRTPQEVADLTLGFPGSQQEDAPRVPALRGGKMLYVPKSQIDLELPAMEEAFNQLSNMIPMKSQVKGQRLVMASRMTTQALPLVDAEAPLVQSAVPGTNGNQSYEELYSKGMGALRAPQAGTVLGVDDNGIRVRYDDGTEDTHELYTNFPFNRKTFVHQTAALNAGDRFNPDQLLAYSNYTDKTGAAALGKNARTAYIAWQGKNFEDATVISESYAKKMSSEHMYQHDLELDDRTISGKNKYISTYPGKYNKQILANIDSSGVIKPGTVVNQGDPLILGLREKETAHNKVHKKGKSAFNDASITWDHNDSGVVTDVVMGKRGPTVVVKMSAPMQIGDKLSGRYGDKGVIADVIPDSQMPHDAEGRPFEVLVNPLGVVTRTNPSQLSELLLGKIAEKRGKPIKVEDFDSSKDMNEWVIQELAKEGLSDLEDIVDPTRERKVKGIATGSRFFMKLHHTAEGKGQSRGGGSYTMEDTPAKGGSEGSKRIGMLDTNALLSHGATATLQDISSVRGQKNDDYWMQFMSGYNPQATKVPYVYQKFVNQLRAAGVNVTKQGTQLNIMALTDKDIDELAGDRELTSAEGVDWGNDLKEVPGGLFDKAKTGGHGGNRWTFIKLHEPMPNPVMEEPIRKILGLTQKKFDSIIAGDENLDGHGSGPAAIQKALKSINLESEINKTRAVIAAGRASERDNAIRKLGYLKSSQKLKLHPSDYMLNKVPVLPPMFRPISLMSNDMPLINDANYLYKELFEANKNLNEIQKAVGADGSGPERLATYQAFRAVTGLGDPISQKSRDKNVQGVLKSVFGSSPKFGTLQRKLISTTVDNVGRAVITPNPDLDMDSVGLPEDKAFKAYEKFVTRRLVRRGMSLREARQQIVDRTDLARSSLLEEMDARPVYISRAPVLHKFGILAMKPRLTKGDTLQVSPLVVKGFNADFDGDAMNYHVPSLEKSVEEAYARLLPSRNLFSMSDFKSVVHAPSNEYVSGLYHATKSKSDRPVKIFRNVADAKRAYSRNEISVDDKIKILEA